MLFMLVLLAMKFPQKITLLVLLSLLSVVSFVALWRTPLYFLDINYNTEKIIVPQPAPTKQEPYRMKTINKDNLLVDRQPTETELLVTQTQKPREEQAYDRTKFQRNKTNQVNKNANSNIFEDKPPFEAKLRKVHNSGTGKLTKDRSGQILRRKKENIKFDESTSTANENNKGTTESLKDSLKVVTTDSRSTTALHRQTKLENAKKEAEPNDSEKLRRKMTADLNKNLINSKLNFSRKYRKLEFIPKKDVHCINTLQSKFYGSQDMPIRIPMDKDLENMSQSEIKCLYHRYVTTRQMNCIEIPQLGNSDLHDNGWHICMDHAYRPSNNSCLVVSVQNGDVNTDFARHVSLQLGCEIHILSPSQTNITHDAPKMYPHTIAATEDKTSAVPLSLSKLKNNETINVLTLKTNTEDIDEFVRSNQTSRVRQLAIVLEASVKHTASEGYRRLLKTLQTLWHQGFRIYHYERKIEDGCLKGVKLRTAFTNCYVLYMVNTNLTRRAEPNDGNRPKGIPETLVFPQDDELQKLSKDELENIYHRYIHSIGYGCREIIRTGNLRDGGWEICHDENIRPRYPCLVYSFGINNDFSFDDDISQTYGCETHSFDPSMHKLEHRRSDRVWFHDLGLLGENREDGGKHGNWKMRTLESIIQKLNHTQKRIDVLKMDIEESEWSALPNMMDTKSLDNVAQLLIEFHGKGNSLNIIKTLKRLHEYGFRIFWTSGNEMCQYKTYNGSRSFCNEVYFVNTKYL